MYRFFITSFIATTMAMTVAVFLVGYSIDPFGHFVSRFSHFPWGEDSSFERGPAYTLNRALFKMVNLRKFAENELADGERATVIVGDSMSNQISAMLLETLSGDPWFNASYGGASFLENMILVERLIEDYPVGRIFWSIPFVRVHDIHRDQMTRALRMSDRPWMHLPTFETLRAVAYVLRRKFFGIEFNDPKPEGTLEEIIAYNLYRTRTDTAHIAWPDEFFARVDAAYGKARSKGIELNFLVVPMHPAGESMFANDLAIRHVPYTRFLDKHCSIDMRKLPGIDWHRDMYRDLYHLRGEYLRLLAENLIEVLETSIVGKSVLPGPVQSDSILPGTVQPEPLQPGPALSSGCHSDTSISILQRSSG